MRRGQATQTQRVKARKQFRPPTLNMLLAHPTSVQEVESRLSVGSVRRALPAFSLVLPTHGDRTRQAGPSYHGGLVHCLEKEELSVATTPGAKPPSGQLPPSPRAFGGAPPPQRSLRAPAVATSNRSRRNFGRERSRSQQRRQRPPRPRPLGEPFSVGGATRSSSATPPPCSSFKANSSPFILRVPVPRSVLRFLGAFFRIYILISGERNSSVSFSSVTPPDVFS